MAGLTLDLKNTHICRNIGDLYIVYTWMNDERAMILIPAHRQKSPWYIVLESASWKYDDVDYLASQSKVACEVLGMRPVPENWMKIANIVHEGLPDLIEMPPAPEVEQYNGSFGKLELRADGEAIAGIDLKLDKEIATYG